MESCKTQRRKWLVVGLGFTAMLSAQTASAQNSFYQGECSRAYEVKANNSLDKLFKYNSYKGVSMHRFEDQTNATCKYDRVVIRYLTRQSISTNSASFDLMRKDVLVGSRPDQCSDLRVLNETAIGTVKFTMEVARDQDLCTVNVWADWNLTDPTVPTWKYSFSNTMLMLNNGSFIVAQDPSSGGQFDTPLSFTGIQ